MQIQEEPLSTIEYGSKTKRKLKDDTLLAEETEASPKQLSSDETLYCEAEATVVDKDKPVQENTETDLEIDGE